MIELISIQQIKKPHSSLSNRDSLTPQEKNNRFPFLDILGYLKIPTKIPNLEERDKSQSGNLVGNSLVGTCLTLPNLGFLWVFFKYPKISKNGNPLFFPVLIRWQPIGRRCYSQYQTQMPQIKAAV